MQCGRFLRPAARLTLLPAILLAAVGCGAGHAREAADGRVLSLKERDFRITVSRAHLAAGEIRLSVRNEGPDRHELILVRSHGRLPMRADGITVDEDALEPVKIGALEPGDVGERELDVRLAPGRYELFCNMSGHFLGGMHAELVVS